MEALPARDDDDERPEDAAASELSEARLARRWLLRAARRWQQRARPSSAAAAAATAAAPVAAELTERAQRCEDELAALAAACRVAEAGRDPAADAAHGDPAAAAILGSAAESIQTQSAALRTRLVQLRRQSAEARELNREAARRLGDRGLGDADQRRRRACAAAAGGSDADRRLLAAAVRVRDLRADKLRVVTGVLRALVFACHVDWADDACLKAAVLELDETAPLSQRELGLRAAAAADPL